MDKTSSILTGPQVKFAAPLEFKFSGTEPGTFEGYASVYGNVDSGGDVVAPGAFKEFVRTRDGKTVVLRSHNANLPIGLADTKQDNHGLHVRGKLLLDNAIAEATHQLMKNGIMTGLSIGYDILPGGAEMLNSGVRRLTGLKLYEVSVVTFAMNEHAQVEAVKSIGAAENPRELEHLLREMPQLGLSSRKAKAAANALWPILRGREVQDEDARDECAEKFMAFANTLDKLNLILKGIE